MVYLQLDIFGAVAGEVLKRIGEWAPKFCQVDLISASISLEVKSAFIFSSMQVCFHFNSIRVYLAAKRVFISAVLDYIQQQRGFHFSRFYSTTTES